MVDSFTFTLYVGLVGLVIGSFLNVVIARLPEGQSLVSPRSHCPHCKNTLRWFHNIPVLSYLVQRGKCVFCGEKISVKYPIVELTTAGLFLIAYQYSQGDLLKFARDALVFSILVPVTFIDLKLKIIPDELSLGGWVFCLLSSLVVSDITFLNSLVGGLVGFGLFFGFSYLYFQLTKREGMGGGDIKLLGMLGSFLGPGSLWSIIFFSSVVGSVVGTVILVLEKKKGGEGLKTAIPYGPFLVFGTLVYYLLGNQWLQYMIPT